MAAIVDVFPDPVGPVSNTRPCLRSIRFAMTGGRCSDSTVGTCAGNNRMLAASVLR